MSEVSIRRCGRTGPDCGIAALQYLIIVAVVILGATAGWQLLRGGMHNRLVSAGDGVTELSGGGETAPGGPAGFGVPYLQVASAAEGTPERDERAEYLGYGGDIYCAEGRCASVTAEGEVNEDELSLWETLLQIASSSGRQRGAMACGDGKCSGEEHPGSCSSDCGTSDGLEMSSRLRERCQQDPTCAAIMTEYSVRPRFYQGLMNGSNEAERQFVAALPEATAFLNSTEIAQRTGVTVTDLEVATTMVAEGGYYPLTENNSEDLHGYFHLGIDSFVSNRAALAPWIHSSVQRKMDDSYYVVTKTNDSVDNPEEWDTLRGLNMSESVYAVGTTYAWSKMVLERNLRAAGVDPATLSDADRFFWTTVYYNAGPGWGKRLLSENGVHGRSGWSNPTALNNATLRTATYEYLGQTTFRAAPGT